MPRGAALAAVIAVAAAGVLASGCAGDVAPKLPKHTVRLEIAGTPSDRPIAPGFVGLSIEYPALFAYAGSRPDALNPTFLRLLEDVAPGESPVLRVGGDTTDWTWWPTHGATRPPWARYVLTPRWIAVLRAVAVATHAKLIPGINFEADSRAAAGAESQALLDGLGRRLIAAFELGNEPEVYGTIGWYANPAGGSVFGRRSSYDVRAFLADYRATSSALPPAVPLAGPALALTWPLTLADRFLSANPRVRLFTFHFYPLKRCYNPPSSPTYPTLDHLLAASSAAPPPGTQAAVAAAHARGVDVRIDEINSVSCRGLSGLSNTFASALWVLDALFHLARAGVDGVNVHTLPHVSYEPFAFRHARSGWLASVKPMYYGMLLFARAAPAGSRLLAIRGSRWPLLRAWATRSRDGTTRVVLINDSAHDATTLAVRPPQDAGSATLERLSAPGLTATSGITLAGQSFGRLTRTAVLAGARQVLALEPVQDRYVVELPPASAALLTLNRG